MHCTRRRVRCEHEGRAVRGEHRKRETGFGGHEGVGFRGCGRRRTGSDDDGVAVDLSKPPPCCRVDEPQAIGQTASILGHRLGRVS